jgi:hypothetical protein
MHTFQSIEVVNSLQTSQIEAIRTEKNMICPEQQPMKESQSISTHSQRTRIVQFAQPENHFQKSQIQATSNLAQTVSRKHAPALESHTLGLPPSRPK